MRICRWAWVYTSSSRHDTIHGPAIIVPPLQAEFANPRPSCRNAVLEAIGPLQRRTGARHFARRDIGTVRARVLEVHGHPGNERVLLEVLDIDDETSEPLTVTYPIRDVHRLTAA